MTTDRFREYDAAYVLGALSSDERRAFEHHLAECTECAGAVRELAGLPGLLATVPKAVAESEPVEPPPTTLLPSLVRRVRRETVRRRWRTGLVAAGVAGLVGLGGLVIGTSGAGAPPAASTPVPTASVPARTMSPVVASDVHASVALVGVAWGTRLEVTCSYDDAGQYAAGAPDAAYVLVVRGRTGQAEQVAHWRGLPGRTMRVAGASALSVGDIASVELQSADGTPLLELRS